MAAQEIIESEKDLILTRIANSITDKMVREGLTLRGLAKEADADYFTLLKIINRKPNYIPNLKVILQLASYLNIQAGDLLNCNDLPQYIPVIAKESILDYINGKFNPDANHERIFCERFVHQQAFAINEVSSGLLDYNNLIYVCYPINDNLLTVGYTYLFIESSILIFGKAKEINNNQITFLSNRKSYIIEREDVIACVVNIRMNETLI